MRIIVYGVGAIGGVLAGALAKSGAEVIGIARGRMLEAVQAKGLRVMSPDMDEVIAVPMVGSPAEIDFRPDDAILLCMKTQDTQPALEALRMAGVTDQPIFCTQNGVANEPLALRMFPNVHGMTVMLPGTYLTPGEVVSHCTPKLGMFDIGRFPKGSDAADEALVELLWPAGFAAFVKPDVMASKYGKLLLNLGNISGAAFGPSAPDGALRKAAQSEAIAVYKAAGIDFVDVSTKDERREKYMNLREVPGAPAMSNSTLQSFQRGNSVETDYMNGEICYLGRLHGVKTPVNDALMALAVRMLRDGIEPGTLDLQATLAELGLA
ncbi:ketopantoate reductase family protein [Rhodobacter sp. NTK016B]|uniref:ketopantoate reductase family protein n=1 Tax=Rhodobacter sp. NTK016B TaxID=2759676 RepID=UPI001A8C6A3A|nr:2-dehydropantoate 2-reductase N-terminal domain-containing protein [Rhodobacter sp. NTK016B]MBN8293542.1 ketopantoate reductase family protein [Rhodobacter sp. NTK016B]